MRVNFLPLVRRIGPLAVLASVFLAGPLQADQRDHDLARQALEQGQVLPLRNVLERIEREQPGQILKIEFEHDDGRFLYKIRLLRPDGRIAKLKVDAVDGHVLSVKDKDH